MKNDLFNCKRERELGIELASALGATQTADAFANFNKNPENIVKTVVDEVCAKDGLETMLANALKGPPRWAAVILRYVPDVGDQRDKLLTKAAEDPSSAYDTLLHVSDVGAHRDALLQSVGEDAGFAHMALKELSDIGSHQTMLVTAAKGPPAERGGGYNTYFVNQTGQALWLRWNTGMRGSTGSLSTPVYLKKGQNTGWGRGGACISGMRVFKTQQDADSWGNGILGAWDYFRIDGCLSWGFLLTPKSGGSINVEAHAWAEGQPGMPGEYPPSYGEG